MGLVVAGKREFGVEVQGEVGSLLDLGDEDSVNSLLCVLLLLAQLALLLKVKCMHKRSRVSLSVETTRKMQNTRNVNKNITHTFFSPAKNSSPSFLAFSTLTLDEKETK